MIVHRPYKSDASYPLKEWDVLTRIGGTPIDNQGMVKLDKDLRVSFAYLIQRSANDGRVPITIIRAGKPMQIELPVSAQHPTLVTDLAGGYPSYFIYGPLVFSTATWQLVSSFEKNAGLLRLLGAGKSPRITRAWGPPAADTERPPVFSSPLFPPTLPPGYSH